jgi:hypothetical protein
MKKYFSIFAAVLYLSSVLMTGCGKSNSSNSGISQQTAGGPWKVSCYFDKPDETSNF